MAPKSTPVIQLSPTFKGSGLVLCWFLPSPARVGELPLVGKLLQFILSVRLLFYIFYEVFPVDLLRGCQPLPGYACLPDQVKINTVTGSRINSLFSWLMTQRWKEADQRSLGCYFRGKGNHPSMTCGLRIRALHGSHTTAGLLHHQRGAQEVEWHTGCS